LHPVSLLIRDRPPTRRQPRPGWAILALALAVSGRVSFAQPASSDSPPTIEVFQRLAELVAQKTADSMMTNDTTSLSIVVMPQTYAWFLEKAIARAFTRRGHTVIGGSDSSVNAEVGMEHLGVTYEGIHRTSFLGSRIVTRKASMKASVTLRLPEPGAALVHREFSELSADTVLVSDIPELESPAIPSTQGVLPTEGFFSNFIEPFIVAASIGVAVYLLFSVRS
jgi:hypothetical protein